MHAEACLTPVRLRENLLKNAWKLFHWSDQRLYALMRTAGSGKEEVIVAFCQAAGLVNGKCQESPWRQSFG